MIKRGLGRGLDALLSPPSKTNLISGRTIMYLKPDLILPNQLQPRKNFHEKKILELADSIREHGVVQPIVVRKEGESYQIVAGERRWRAAQLAGLETIPVIVKDLDTENAMAVTLVENLQREDLSPIEEAKAYHDLSERFQLTQDVIAKKVGKSRSAVANSLRLLKLPSDILASIEKGDISSGHARALLSITDTEKQMALWHTLLKQNINVRHAEKMAGTLKKKSRLSRIKTDTDFNTNHALETLTRLLATKVSLKGTKDKGVLSIHYFSQDDLERILQKIDGHAFT